MVWFEQNIYEMEMGMIRNCNETPFGNGAIGCRGKPSLLNKR